MPERELYEHSVQFYETDPALSDSLTSFIASGLTAGDACIVVATSEHRGELERRLRATGIAVDAARAAGTYVPLDADETLGRIMVDGTPDPARFAEVIGGELTRAARGGRGLRVFGEMVGRLLARGQVSATVGLEDLWNELRRTLEFRLFCGYSLAEVDERGLAGPIAEVCARHSRVIPVGDGVPDGTARGRLGELETQIEDLRRLHETSLRLTSLLDVETVLREVLRAAMAVQATGLGLLSLCDAEQPRPAPRGAAPGSTTSSSGTSRRCRREAAPAAPRTRSGGASWSRIPRWIPIFAPYREAARRAGFRACHSTPLISRRGRHDRRAVRIVRGASSAVGPRDAAHGSLRAHRDRLDRECPAAPAAAARIGGPTAVARPRARRPRGSRDRQPDEGRVPGHRLARAADAAERDPGLVAHPPLGQAGRDHGRPGRRGDRAKRPDPGPAHRGHPRCLARDHGQPAPQPAVRWTWPP